MHRIISYLIAPFLILIASLFFVSTNQDFYAYQFEKNATNKAVDIPAQYLPEVVEHLTGYLAGRYQSFNHQLSIDGVDVAVYNGREVLHMADVRQIFDGLKWFALVGLVVTFSSALIEANKMRLLGYLARLAKMSLLGIVLISLAIAVLIALDFNRYFIAFHHLFFDNDLWLLNPETDLLIQMLPQVFFQQIALLILAVAVVIAIFLVILTSWLARRQSRV